MGTVIIGGGIIGLSTAYYLSKQQRQGQTEQSIHIIDSAPSLLLSASGFAGGFLAKDWFSSAAAPLGALSFRLHVELAQENDGFKNWGYSSSIAYSLSIDGSEVGARGKERQIQGEDWLVEGFSRSAAATTRTTENNKPTGRNNPNIQVGMLNDDGTPAWATRQEGGSLEVISGEASCAQVEPRELCDWLIDQCQQRGVVFHLGCQVQRLKSDGCDGILGISSETESDEWNLKCSHVVLSAGAWTPRVFQRLFPNSKIKIPIDPLAGYSIVVRSPRYSRPIVDPARHGDGGNSSMCHSIFSAPGPSWKYAPEAISRMTKDGRPEIYVAGLNDSEMLLPPNAADVKDMKDGGTEQELRRTTILLTGLCQEGDDLVEDDLEIVRQGLCFRPVTKSGVPIVSKLTSSQTNIGPDAQRGPNVYVAAGHGPWGISLGPGTGKVISEMLQGLEPSADISALKLN